MRVTQKCIKEFVRHGIADDLTNTNYAAVNGLYKAEHGFTTINYSVGTYGINGILVKGNESQQLYAVTSRSTNLFVIM